MEGLFFHSEGAVVGTSWRPDPDAPTTWDPRDNPMPLLAAWTNRDLHGIASLANTSKIDVCQTESLGTWWQEGMLIHHFDGSLEAIGAYDSRGTGIITIYDASIEEPLLGIAFRSVGGMVSNLRAVTVSSPEPDRYEVYATKVSAMASQHRPFCIVRGLR